MKKQEQIAKLQHKYDQLYDEFSRSSHYLSPKKTGISLLFHDISLYFKERRLHKIAERLIKLNER